MGNHPRDIKDVLNQLTSVKPAGKGKWTADCPIAGHQTPRKHLSIEDAGDKVLLHCFPNNHEYSQFCEALGYESLSYKSNGNSHEHLKDTIPTSSEIVAIYKYQDATGKPYEVVRFNPKDFRQRQFDDKGNPIWNLNAIIPTLYHQTDIKQAVKGDSVIYIVEGEKDAESLWSIGLVATTNPGGAGKWRDEYSKVLRKASVVIIPDNDEPGRKHAAQVAQSVYGKANRIRLVELPDDYKDISEYLTEHDYTELELLVAATPDYIPGAEPSRVTLRNMADVKAEDVTWLWYPYLPKKKLTLLEGDPGAGKSWFSLGIATAVTLGQGLPHTDSFPSGNVLMASAEDGLSDTIKPRLINLGADSSKVYAIDGLFTLDIAGCKLLDSYISELRPLLVIIDPLVAFMSSELDINKANQVRQVTARLASLAENRNTTILAIRHLTKGGSAKPIYRGLGSIDFTAAARCVLMAGQDPDTEERGVIHIKHNLSTKGEPIGYEITPEGKFYWKTSCNLTIGQILSQDDGGDKIREAQNFLLEILDSGAVLSDEITKEADARGIAPATLNRAKGKLGIKSEREGNEGKRGAGKWYWILPGSDKQKGLTLSSSDNVKN